MRKALSSYCTLYNVYIVTKLTLSSLALTIFRTNYDDQNHWPIHIPNRNEETLQATCLKRRIAVLSEALFPPYSIEDKKLRELVMTQCPMLTRDSLTRLYGRWSMNPKCTITEVCNLDRS